jgi:hypothetical protein
MVRKGKDGSLLIGVSPRTATPLYPKNLVHWSKSDFPGEFRWGRRKQKVPKCNFHPSLVALVFLYASQVQDSNDTY